MDPRNINNDMAVRALNYHGQQLTSFLKDEPMFMHLDLRNVDYHMYQVQMSRDLENWYLEAGLDLEASDF